MIAGKWSVRSLLLAGMISFAAGAGSFFKFHGTDGRKDIPGGGSRDASGLSGARPDRERPQVRAGRNEFDPKNPLPEVEYRRLYDEALDEDAKFDPKLATVLQLRKKSEVESARLKDLEPGFGKWFNQAADEQQRQERIETFVRVRFMASRLAMLQIWEDQALKELFRPQDETGRRGLAKSLAGMGIDPAVLLEEGEPSREALDDLRERLAGKIGSEVSAAGGPPDLFNTTTYGMMTEDGMAEQARFLAYELASPRTKKFSDAAHAVKRGRRLDERGPR